MKTYPGLTGQRLDRELKAMGYTGGYTKVKVFLRDVGPREEKGYKVRFETPPGVQAKSTSLTSRWCSATSCQRR